MLTSRWSTLAIQPVATEMKPVGGCQYEVVLPLAPVGIMYYFEAQELNGKSGITWMSSGRSRIMSLGIGAREIPRRIIAGGLAVRGMRLQAYSITW